MALLEVEMGKQEQRLCAGTEAMHDVGGGLRASINLLGGCRNGNGNRTGGYGTIGVESC